MYKLYKNSMGEIAGVRNNEGSCIPFDPANSDYQDFLRWCEEGGVPEAAE